MNWLNLRVSTVRAPEYVGCDPEQRATWFNVMAYSAEQENGGRIVGARTWKDRQWQQTCGVTLAEVSECAPLLSFDGDDLIVWSYPAEREEEVRGRRESGRKGGSVSSELKAEKARQNGAKGGRPKNPTKPKQNNPITQAENPSRNPRNPSKGDSNRVNPSQNPTLGEGEDKEKRREERAFALPDGLGNRFAQKWESYVDFRKRSKFKTLLPESVETQWRNLAKFGEETACEAIEKTIANGWQGIFPERIKPLNGNSSPSSEPDPKADPPRWRDFLKSLGQPYREHRFSPQAQRETEFWAWRKGTPA